MKTLTPVLVRRTRSAYLAVAVSGMALLGALPQPGAAQGVAEKTQPALEANSGQTVYVPVYSHIHQGRKLSRQPLSSTLAIHNVNATRPILITDVSYYDHSGAKLKDFIDNPLTLTPFESTSFVVGINEDRGGVGANFIVEWQAAEKVVSPIIEGIMSGGTGTQGLSFVTRGTVIRTRP